MYILTIKKFESFFPLEADVIHVIRFPHLSRFESDGASAYLMLFFIFISASSDYRKIIPKVPHSLFPSRNLPIN